MPRGSSTMLRTPNVSAHHFYAFACGDRQRLVPISGDSKIGLVFDRSEFFRSPNFFTTEIVPSLACSLLIKLRPGAKGRTERQHPELNREWAPTRTVAPDG